MGLSDTLSDSMTNFEKYNNKEVYNFGSFVVTGRLVSAFFGFIVIILMLMITFSSAANSFQVANLGGNTAFTADVIITENTGPSLSGTLEDEDDFVDFGYVLEEVDWDYTSNMRISHFDVVFDWSFSGGGGAGRQVKLDVSSQNNSTDGESQLSGGNGAPITIPWPVNQLPETVSGTADNPDAFLLSFETDGEWMGGRFTYTSESTLADNPLSPESLDYTITLIYYTWDFENIREIAEV
tara:strand:- start:21 stop:737 length:717 start_codon:yes stop_codon:yes gene_type:complete